MCNVTYLRDLKLQFCVADFYGTIFFEGEGEQGGNLLFPFTRGSLVALYNFKEVLFVSWSCDALNGGLREGSKGIFMYSSQKLMFSPCN